MIDVAGLPEFATAVGGGHVWHRSLDGEPLKVQANATFAHRLDWFAHCRFCSEVRAVFICEERRSWLARFREAWVA